MTTHSKLSPSSAYRWLACPGSVREEAKYPEPPSGPGAIDGTHSHTLLEHCIKGNGDPSKMVGIKLKDHEGEFVVDRARADRVAQALTYVRQRAGFMGQVVAESRVQPAHFLGRDDMSGTADVQITTPDVFEVIDFKDGMNEVTAKDNPQLELYALGALAKLKLPINGDYGFQTVRTTIIQPKMALKGLPIITSHDLTIPELMGKIGKFVAGAAATDQPDAPLVSGSHCKYCKHKSCSQRAGDLVKEMGMSFPVLNQPVNPVAELSQQAADLDPNTMTPEKIAQIMLAAPLVRQMIESVEEEALRRLKAGQVIPGLKVVHGRGSRSWALPEEEMATKLTGMGIPKGVIWETKLVTPAKVEKLKWEKTKAGEKVQAQLSERQLKTLDTEYIAKVAGKLTVVPESDSRPAVVLDASPLFAAVPQAPVAEALPSWLS
jgi:hypothetical protein